LDGSNKERGERHKVNQLREKESRAMQKGGTQGARPRMDQGKEWGDLGGGPAVGFRALGVQDGEGKKDARLRDGGVRLTKGARQCVVGWGSGKNKNR